MIPKRAEDEAATRVLGGETWREFCEGLMRAGSVILGPNTPPSAFDKAEGFRYLSRITRAALETFVENADPLAPTLQRVVHETAKMGADNPDNLYLSAPISGVHDYRIRGNRGTVHYLGFATQIGHYGQGGGMPPTGHVEAAELELQADGSFELILSRTRPERGNWLPMTEDTGTLIVRQTFLDRENERPAELRLERVGGPSKPGPLTPAQLDYGLAQSAMLVQGAAALFQNWVEGFMRHTNQLPRFSDETSRAFGGDPNIAYYHSHWRLAPDEALVIDAKPPECLTWNFQLNNHWMESLDYRYFQIVVNKHTARYRADGSVRIVVAHQDPCARADDNWIDTTGHDSGTMCLRWVRAKEHPEPTTRVLKVAALRAEVSGA